MGSWNTLSWEMSHSIIQTPTIAVFSLGMLSQHSWSSADPGKLRTWLFPLPFPPTSQIFKLRRDGRSSSFLEFLTGFFGATDASGKHLKLIHTHRDSTLQSSASELNGDGKNKYIKKNIKIKKAKRRIYPKSHLRCEHGLNPRSAGAC